MVLGLRCLTPLFFYRGGQFY